VMVGLIIIISTILKTKNNDARFIAVLVSIVWPLILIIYSPIICMILFYKIVVFIIGSKEQ
jgi:Na+/H+ antiporter NhaB